VTAPGPPDPTPRPRPGALRLDARARKAVAVELDPDLSAGRAVAVVAGECVTHWRTNETMLLATRAAPHLHQTRVGIRRLRSAFSLFGPVVRRVPEARPLVHRLRSLALPFGTARDLDVLLSGPLVEPLDDRQRARLLEDREGAYDTVLAVLHSPEWSDTGHDLDHLLASAPAWPDAGDLTTLAGAALDKRSRRVVRHAHDLADLSTTDRHAVRIEAKKLRYGCEFFAALFPSDRPRTTDEDGTVLTGLLAHARMVEDVQSALGALNDHATADALLHRVGARAPALDETALLGEAVAAVRRLADSPPPWH
jgi:triphosphatase